MEAIRTASRDLNLTRRERLIYRFPAVNHLRPQWGGKADSGSLGAYFPTGWAMLLNTSARACAAWWAVALL
jgi:hypothetical protein